MISREAVRQLLSFGTIGVLGLVSDIVVLTTALRVFELDMIPARLCAFGITVTITWWLNRKVTFRSRSVPRTEWLLYSSVNGLGMLLNLGLFFLLVFQVRVFSEIPVLALVCAALVTMSYSFLISKFVVFRNAATKPR